MVLVFAGVWQITIPKKNGLYWMILAQIFWSIFAVMTGSWFLLLQNVVLLGFNVRGIRNWTAKGIG